MMSGGVCVAEANSYLTCGSCMCPQCVSLFLLVIENYDMGVRYTPLRSIDIDTH